MLREQRRAAAILWCVQGDASAKVEAEAKSDGGGGVRSTMGDARKTMRRRGTRGKVKMTLGPIYKVNG